MQSDASDRFYSTYRRPLTDWRAAPGFTQHDYALRNAAWHVTDIFAELYEDDDRRDGFLDPLSMLREGAGEQITFDTPEAASDDVKHIAEVVGADLVGIAPYDERWVYTERFSVQEGGGKPNDLPDGLSHVIVIGQSMDHDLTRTAPSALAGTATGLGYSLDSVVLLTIAQYIRNLGYQAIPSMNDTALAIPYALEAGLGEYGRHGLLITPEFGPRLRLGKIFTDMPLQRDHPKSFGVERFCDGCRRCTDACPAKAIPGGRPSAERHNRSNLVGVRNGRSTASSASSTGRRSTPTVRCASGSARTTAIIPGRQTGGGRSSPREPRSWPCDSPTARSTASACCPSTGGRPIVTAPRAPRPPARRYGTVSAPHRGGRRC